MRLSTRALSLTIVIIITGCISIRPRQEPLPEWVENVPVDSTYFYGVGVGEDQSPAMARYKADIRARDGLVRSVEVHIRKLHKLILSQLDTLLYIPDWPEIIYYFRPPDSPEPMSWHVVIVDRHFEWDGGIYRVYALTRASREVVYEAFLDWVRPRVHPEYYDLLVKLLKKEGA